MLWIFDDYIVVPISLACKKKTAVSHSSTEAEVLSLNNGLRMEGLLALTLWDIVSVVLELPATRARVTPSRHQKFKKKTKTTQKTADHISPHAQESRNLAQFLKGQ